MRKYWWFLSALVLLQCSDEETVKKETCKVLNLKYIQLSYDSEGRLAEIVQTDDNNEPVPEGSRREFFYEGDQVISMDDFNGTDLTRKFTFEYSAGQIIQREYWTPGDNNDESVDYTVTFLLNSEGKVERLNHESWNLDEPYSHIYEYEGGNVIKVTGASESRVYFVQEFEFDEHLNPMSQEGFEMTFHDNIFSNTTQNVNNITKYTLMPSTVSNYSYLYDERGYPTQRFLNGSTTPNYFFEYECK